MPARTLLNLFLAAAAIALGLVMYFQPGLESDPVPQPLTTRLDPDAVTVIRIERAARGPLTFIRREGVWHLLNGNQELPASAFQIQSLLRLPKATTTLSYPANTLNLEELGLKPPQATVNIEGVQFRLGTTEPLTNRRYILVDDTVYLIEDQYQHLINADWSNFVSRQLLPAGSTITALQLPDMEVHLSADGTWEVTPADAGVNADAVRQLVENWQLAGALYVRRFDGRDSGDSIGIRTQDDPDGITLRVLARSPELVLARPDQGIQYHLSADEADGLLSPGEPGEAEDAGTVPDSIRDGDSHDRSEQE